MRIRLAIALTATLVTVLPLFALSAPLSASAASDDFTFTSFNADYYLGRDDQGNARLRTVETLVAVFPEFDQNHGIERAIPLKYDGAMLDLSIVSVTDGDGRNLNYTRDDERDFAVLRIGDADRFVHGSQSYRIEYTQANVVRHFADTAADEFYWDVNGSGWGQPFGTVSATVHLDETISASLTGNLACYQGYEGSTDRCQISKSGDTIVAEAAHLDSYQNMTIAIGFDSTTFADPPLARNHWVFTILPWILLALTLLSFITILVTRLFFWRDARGRGIIIAQYSPPKSAFPLLAGELLNRQRAGLPAQIVSFAVNRALAIREHPSRPEGRRYELELIAGWPTIEGEEKKVLQALFGTLALGERQELDASNTTLGDRLAKRRAAVAQQVIGQKLRAKPKTRIQILTGSLTFVSAAIAVIIWLCAPNFDAYSQLFWMSALACVVGWILTMVVGTRPYLMTDAGAELRDYLYGIRDYLQLAEADRIRMLQAPDTALRVADRIDTTDRSAVITLYEKLLPYAMIFGIEKEWIAELGSYYAQSQTPDWYTGGDSLAGLAVFSSTMRMTSFTTTPPVSSSGSGWSSSGGSSSFGGSSGGGSSGGGGGGGGGGGW